MVSTKQPPVRETPFRVLKNGSYYILGTYVLVYCKSAVFYKNALVRMNILGGSSLGVPVFIHKKESPIHKVIDKQRRIEPLRLHDIKTLKR